MVFRAGHHDRSSDGSANSKYAKHLSGRSNNANFFSSRFDSQEELFESRFSLRPNKVKDHASDMRRTMLCDVTIYQLARLDTCGLWIMSNPIRIIVLTLIRVSLALASDRNSR